MKVFGCDNTNHDTYIEGRMPEVDARADSDIWWRVVILV